MQRIAVTASNCQSTEHGRWYDARSVGMPKAGRHRSRGAVGLGLQGQSQNRSGLMDPLSYALPLLGHCVVATSFSGLLEVIASRASPVLTSSQLPVFWKLKAKTTGYTP